MSDVRFENLDQAFSQVDLQQLPPFLRVLLMTDGTVTSSLEAYFWEPIKVRTLEQSLYQSPGTDPHLNNDTAESMIKRQVNLVGVDSKTIYANAESIIRTSLLPTGIATALKQGEIGVGELIRERGLETFRDIQAIGFDGPDGALSVVWRCYRIVREGLPFIKITERFPIAIYKP